MPLHDDRVSPRLPAGTGPGGQLRPRHLMHPFQCIARLNVSNVTGQTLILLALGLKLFAVDCQSGQVMTSWDAESAGAKGYISLMAINDYFTYVAVVTTEDKAVHILSTSLTCLLLPLNRRILPKRPSCISWTPDQLNILAGDKFGDVYALPLHILPRPAPTETSACRLEQESLATEDNTEQSTTEPAVSSDRPPTKRFKPSATELTVHSGRNLRALENQKRTAASAHDAKKETDPSLTVVLGHVSMLTALTSKSAWPVGASEPSRTFIITADRDEHIRVSRGIPQAHIIETYCLGHTSFVSTLTVPHEPAGNLLFSGGGDDWIGVWDWLRGRLLCKIPLAPAFVSDRGMSGKPLNRPIAVIGIWYWPVPDPMTDDWIRVAVACEGMSRLLTLTCKTLEPTSLDDFEQRTYELPGNVLDCAVMNAETVVLSLGSAHSEESMGISRNLDTEQQRIVEEHCPRLFVMHISGGNDPDTSTAYPDPGAETCVPFDLDLTVGESLKWRGADVVLDPEKDQARLEEILYGVEKLRKWAGEHEDA